MNEGPASPSRRIASGGPTARARLHPLWVIVAALLLVGGLAAAVLAARSVARSETANAQDDFERAAADLAAGLQLAIQHQDDLVVNASAFVDGNPAASNAEFGAWAASAHVLDRYPEVLGVGLVVLVPAPDLAASGPATAVVPPGDRPYSCLTKFGVSRDPALLVPGMDWCAGSGLGEARDTGRSSYAPVAIEARQLLAVNVPVYRGGIVPGSVDERREAFMGWVGTVSAPEMLLDRARAEHPELAVTMRYRVDTSDVAFSSGSVPENATSAAFDLGNGWTISTQGTVPDRGVRSGGDSLLLLLGVAAISALLAALVLLLGTGRSRALRLVEQRTGELRHQALHDALTGLPNRVLIMDRIEQLLARSRRQGGPGAALYLDLDDFKNVNDTLGHDAGDRLLVAVASRLSSALRDADTIGRMGGDEFVVLIDCAQLGVAPELVAKRLLDVMCQPFDLDGSAVPLLVGMSIGIAIGDRASPGELLRDADVALYEAKAGGKGRYATFLPEMQTEIMRRMAFEFDLRVAQQEGQFHLAYQPIYNLDDLSLVGVEALLRWDHPRLGPVVPDEFVPVLEQTNQIQEVGRWVLHEACAQMAAWHALGFRLDLSVNVSGRQLDHDAIIEHIREALERSGLDGTSLIVEVTETALMRNAAETARRLAAIKLLGVRIAVDDFGTGYSSLAYLRQFPVDCLKIDRRFTNAITTSPESKALIGTLVQLGKDLGMITLAEGVETTGELDHLISQHVDEAQGFLLSRPLDPDALEEQLLERGVAVGANRPTAR